MYLCIYDNITKEEALSTEVINMQTGEKILYVIRANDKTGEYDQYIVDKNGVFIIEEGSPKIGTFKGNIGFRRLS